MKRHFQCVEQVKSPSNLTKYCACHEILKLKISADTPWMLPPIERRFDDNPRISEDKIVISHPPLRGPYSSPSWRRFCIVKYNIFALRLSPKMSRSAAPVTKSHPPTSPNTAPATQNELWIVTLLNCDCTELLLDWTVTVLNCDFTELWTVLNCYLTDVTWLNCDCTELLLYWPVTLLNCDCTELWLYWTVTWLICYLTETVTLLTCYITELLLYWTVTLLNCYFTELWLYWTVILLNCYLTDLWLYWTVILLNCYLTDLLLYWTVTLLNCYITELLLYWIFSIFKSS